MCAKCIHYLQFMCRHDDRTYGCDALEEVMTELCHAKTCLQIFVGDTDYRILHCILQRFYIVKSVSYQKNDFYLHFSMTWLNCKSTTLSSVTESGQYKY